MTISFDEDKQRLKLQDIHDRQEEVFLQTIADNLGIPFIRLYPSIIEGASLAHLEEEKARAGRLIPFKIEGKKLSVALRNPDNPKTKEFLNELKNKGFDLKINLISDSTLEKCFEAYKDISWAKKTSSNSVEISPDSVKKYIEEIKTTEDAKNAINQTVARKEINYISKILEIIMASAIAVKSSDIHIEPEQENARLRFRLDGELYDITNIPNKVYMMILSRIKLISGLKLNLQKEAQDGRFGVNLSDRTVEIRVSSVPGGFGESVVMRLLDPLSIKMPFESIGISEYLMPIVMETIQKPKGMILTTGPTGSGKTTTLYSFMQKIYTPEIKIMTIEDPIEYRLPGIVQTQAKDDGEYSFAEGLRAILRQDPDVIMVGEIRDESTAKTAIDSALTGHLVFSTLHTNNSAGAFTRLIDLKINPKVITSALKLALAQRLVRKLCQKCKMEKKLEGEEKKLIEDIIKNFPKGVKPKQTEKIWQAKGCKVCHNTGFAGRVGIFEAIISDSAIEKIVQENPSEREIKNVARPQGLPSMREDAVLKILDGTTSLEEIKNKIDLTEN